VTKIEMVKSGGACNRANIGSWQLAQLALNHLVAARRDTWMPNFQPHL